MWLRDYLPTSIPNVRVLIYGYPSQLQGSMSQSILANYSNNFIGKLFTLREHIEVSGLDILVQFSILMRCVRVVRSFSSVIV
jgi:hypothetical protein